MKKLFVLFIALVMLLTAAAAQAESKIAVSGTGEIRVSADTAVISLGVSSRDKDVLKAQQKVNESIAAIRSALTEQGISGENINTEFINIYVTYDYRDDQEEVEAYNASSTLAIKVTEMDKVGALIDAAFSAGANTLNGISFSATDTSKAREKAMRAAVDDARAKAEILADAAGLRIFGIEEIREQGTYSSDRGAGNFFKSEQAMGSSADTIVKAAKLSVSSSITVTFKVN